MWRWLVNGRRFSSDVGFCCFPRGPNGVSSIQPSDNVFSCSISSSFSRSCRLISAICRPSEQQDEFRLFLWHFTKYNYWVVPSHWGIAYCGNPTLTCRFCGFANFKSWIAWTCLVLQQHAALASLCALRRHFKVSSCCKFAFHRGTALPMNLQTWKTWQVKQHTGLHCPMSLYVFIIFYYRLAAWRKWWFGIGRFPVPVVNPKVRLRGFGKQRRGGLVRSRQCRINPAIFCQAPSNSAATAHCFGVHDYRFPSMFGFVYCAIKKETCIYLYNYLYIYIYVNNYR